MGFDLIFFFFFFKLIDGVYGEIGKREVRGFNGRR